MEEQRLDILIFGATGFTGKYVVKEALKLCKNKPFSWGIAGRNKERLKSILKDYAESEADTVPVVIADLKDDKSLNEMTRKCKIVVNCCGPYRLYGEKVIKACIATKTHHVDVSGEPQFMEEMQLEYNKAAQEAGIYCISSCGFDSIPCDLGIIFTQRKFQGEVNSIETYLNFWKEHNLGGASLNYGTYESAVYGVAHANELRSLRSKLYPARLPTFEPKLRSRGLIHRSEISPGWSLPFLGSDKSVAYRTQRFLFEKEKKRPAQVQTYVTFNSIFTVIAVACFGALFSLMSKCKCGRSLLLKHPRFFSGGTVSHDGPNPDGLDQTFFSITLKADGWKDKLAESTDQHVETINKEMITKVSGKNPGYGATCTMLMISALTILRESDKMPDNGGVLSPGAAFGNTSLIDELNNNGVKFEIISSIEK